jgi:RNA 2',3'-cyclic 3'-phosphodiesterase
VDREGERLGGGSGPFRLMSQTTRTFFAIEIPEPMGRALREVQRTLAPELTGCRWTSEKTPFHLTLAFLGDVRNGDLGRLVEAVATSVGQFPPCELHFEGVGAFPSPRRPRVVWAGLPAREPTLLDEIQLGVAGVAAAAGYPSDERFHPHVTLGRFKPGRRGPCDLTEVVERYRSWSCGEFTALEVVGFASRLAAEGPSYEPLGRARLAGAKSPPSP